MNSTATMLQPRAKPGRPKGGKNREGHKAGRPRKQPLQITQSPDTLAANEKSTTAPESPNLHTLNGRLAIILPHESTSGNSKDISGDYPWWREAEQRLQEDNVEGEDPDETEMVGLGTLMRELDGEGTKNRSDYFTDLEPDEDEMVGLGTLMKALEQKDTDFRDYRDRGTSVLDPRSQTAYFSRLQERLRREKVPKEYSLGTFWVVPDNTDPSSRYLPKVFLWLPHLLVSEPIQCSCGARLESKGYNKDPHARRVVDLDGHFFLMTMRYRCKTCATTLNGTDKRILERLPWHLQIEFPARLTHRGAVSKALWEHSERTGGRIRKRSAKSQRAVSEQKRGSKRERSAAKEEQEEGGGVEYAGVVAMKTSLF